MELLKTAIANLTKYDKEFTEVSVGTKRGLNLMWLGMLPLSFHLFRLSFHVLVFHVRKCLVCCSIYFHLCWLYYVISYSPYLCVCVVDANFWLFCLSGKSGQSTSHVGSFGGEL